MILIFETRQKFIKIYQIIIEAENEVLVINIC